MIQAPAFTVPEPAAGHDIHHGSIPQVILYYDGKKMRQEREVSMLVFHSEQQYNVLGVVIWIGGVAFVTMIVFSDAHKNGKLARKGPLFSGDRTSFCQDREELPCCRRSYTGGGLSV